MACSGGAPSWGSSSEETDFNSEVFQQHVEQDPMMNTDCLELSGLGKTLLNNCNDNENNGESTGNSPLNSTVIEADSSLRNNLKRMGSPDNLLNPAKTMKMNVSILKITGTNLMEKNQVKLKQFFSEVDTSFNRDTVKIHKEYITIKVSEQKVKEKLLKVTKILGTDVTVLEITKSQRQSSSVDKGDKVIIFGVPCNISIDEIKEECECLEARRLEKKSLDPMEPRQATSPVVLTYSVSPPLTVYIGLQRYKTKVFIPNPIRCFKCQRFGHVATSCRSNIRCPRCAQEHDFANCPLNTNDNQNSAITLKCPNCGGDHSAAFKGCRSYITAREITTIKVTNRISYAEAAKKVLAIKNSSGTEIPPTDSVDKTIQNIVDHCELSTYAVPWSSSEVVAAKLPDCDPTHVGETSGNVSPGEASCKVILLLSRFFNLLIEILKCTKVDIFCSAISKFINEFSKSSYVCPTNFTSTNG